MEDLEAILEENRLLKEERFLIEQEFQKMEEEILQLKQISEEKTTECIELRARLEELTCVNKPEVNVKKMVEEMEELHENLAELDSRFERSETHNKELRTELEASKLEMEKQVDELNSKLASSSEALRAAQEESTKLQSEFDMFKKESSTKIQNLRDSFKQSIEVASAPTSKFIKQNRGSKSPLKKVRSYKLLKEVDEKLQGILKEVEVSQ